MHPKTNLLMLYKYKLRYIRYYARDRERGQTMKKLLKRNSSKIKDFAMLHHIEEKRSFYPSFVRRRLLLRLDFSDKKSQVTQNIFMHTFLCKGLSVKITCHLTNWLSFQLFFHWSTCHCPIWSFVWKVWTLHRTWKKYNDADGGDGVEEQEEENHKSLKWWSWES